jgi:hypothetical protein
LLYFVLARSAHTALRHWASIFFVAATLVITRLNYDNRGHF